MCEFIDSVVQPRKVAVKRSSRARMPVPCSAGCPSRPGVHEHEDSAAAIVVLEGAIIEGRLGFGAVSPIRYEAGELVEVPADAIRRVRHAGSAPAVTLHRIRG